MPEVGAHSSSHRHLVLFIMFSYNTLISIHTMPRFSRLRFWGGYMRISFQPPLMHCIYMCVHLFLDGGVKEIMQHVRTYGPQHESRYMQGFISSKNSSLNSVYFQLSLSRVKSTPLASCCHHDTVNPSFWKGFVSFCNIVLHKYPIAN